MRGPGLAKAIAAALLVACLTLGRITHAALPDGFEEAVLQIQINKAAANEMVVALRGDQLIWLDADDFARLRLRTPDREPLIVEGIPHYPLQDIPEAIIEFEDATQTVVLTVPPRAFLSANISLAETPAHSIAQSSFGGFLNYEVSAEHGETGGTAQQSQTFGTATTELGFFGPHGVVTNTAIGQYSDATNRVVRLETTWTYDFPERLQTARAGDVISSSGRWSRAIRMGGIQWGSNFAVRPDLVTLPLLTAAGEAVVPSTVDVFVNSRQVATEQVPAGPFIIDRLPAISGAGDVRLVVRDAFGREQVITAPFYASSTLLRKGLADYSVELGSVRENFTLASNDYDSLLLSGTYRRGFSDTLTLEGHGEYQQDGAQALGLDATVGIGTLGLLSATAAHGSDANDSGFLAALGFERSARRMSFNVRSQIASDGFRQVGDTELTERPSQQHSAQVSTNLGRFGSFALAYVHATYPDDTERKVGTLSHSMSIGTFGYLGVNISYTWAEENSINGNLIFTMPFGDTRSASLSARYDKSDTVELQEAIATFQQSPPIGRGYGYRVAASSEGNYSAGWRAHMDALAFEAEAAKYLQTSAVRATLSGAAVGIGGNVYGSRSVLDSFALVDVAGIPEMSVLVDNQIVRRTDEDGRALIRNLRAYDVNRISVDARELPLDTHIESDKITVTPRYRSGVVVKFPITRERNATFRLVQQDGKPVPSGGEVIFRGQRFPVAQDGYVYVTGLDHGMTAEADWTTGRCAFRIPPPPSDDPLPDLGTVVCRAPQR